MSGPNGRQLAEPGDAAAITQVVARVAFLADHGDIDDYLDLLADDVGWHMPANPGLGLAADDRSGRAAVRDGIEARRASGVQGPGTATKHVVTNTSALADGPDGATADTYWHFYRSTTDTPRLVAMGRYEDRFRRVDGGWVLAERHIIRD